MLLGDKLELSPTLLHSILNTSTAQSWSSSSNNPHPSASRKPSPSSIGYEGGRQTTRVLNDLKLALQAGTARGSPMPIGYSAAMLYENVVEDELPSAKVTNKGEKDFSVVYESVILSLGFR